MRLYESLYSLAERCEPFSFIYDAGKFAAHVFLYGVGVAVKDKLFQLLMRLHEDGSARGLIDTAGFHADHTVFYDIYDADAVLTAQLV